MHRILITGAAGFIGFHLARHLKKRGDFVVGLDHFNAYYSVALKKARTALLQKMGIEVLPADILQKKLLMQLITQHEITHVVHLAAQAGVRHSLQHPEDYITCNLQGFSSVLEACRHFPSLKLIYASSSSVYGLNEKTPFHPDDRTDRPVNLYGASKKANELMAYSYHHLYGLSVTALRFFTVYGPWGRPDMAYYHFSEKIVRNEPISVFHHGQMRRDFTYIDDIVRGTQAAIDLGAACEVFNLGNHSSVPLLHLIELLEKGLGKTAQKKFLPMQPGEVLETYADIEKSRKMLSFEPKVSLEEGISYFLEWFRSYHLKSQATAPLEASTL